MTRIELRRLLTKLYPTDKEARCVVTDLGIQGTNIDFSGSANVMWEAALKEIEKWRMTDRLLVYIANEYPKLLPTYAITNSLESVSAGTKAAALDPTTRTALQRQFYRKVMCVCDCKVNVNFATVPLCLGNIISFQNGQVFVHCSVDGEIRQDEESFAQLRADQRELRIHIGECSFSAYRTRKYTINKRSREVIDAFVTRQRSRGDWREDWLLVTEIVACEQVSLRVFGGACLKESECTPLFRAQKLVTARMSNTQPQGVAFFPVGVSYQFLDYVDTEEWLARLCPTSGMTSKAD